MAKQRKAEMFDPAKRSKFTLPGTVKDEVETKAKDLVETVLKPRHIQPPTGDDFNFITDITTKWVGSKLYFISIYCCPGPIAISPIFEDKFACLELVGNVKFNLSFMRHTGKWVQLYTGVSLDESLKAIQDDPWFHP